MFIEQADGASKQRAKSDSRPDTEAVEPSETKLGRQRGRIGKLGRSAAVGAVALTLAAGMTGSADARLRSAAVQAINGAIDMCFVTGGDPYVYEFEGSFNFACIHADGEHDFHDSYYDAE